MNPFRIEMLAMPQADAVDTGQGINSQKDPYLLVGSCIDPCLFASLHFLRTSPDALFTVLTQDPHTFPSHKHP